MISGPCPAATALLNRKIWASAGAEALRPGTNSEMQARKLIGVTAPRPRRTGVRSTLFNCHATVVIMCEAPA